MISFVSILKPVEISRDNYRLFIALNYLCYLGIFAHLLFIPLFYWLDVWELVLVNIFSVLMWVVGFFLNRAARHIEAAALLIFEAVLHAALACYFLGWEAGFQYYFFSTVLFICIDHRQKVLTMIIQAVVIFGVYIGLYRFTHQTDFVTQIPEYVLNILHIMNLFVNFSAFGIQGYFFRTASIRAEKQMELLATTDPLTGLFNRKKMLDLISREVVRYQRNKKVFLLAITDIDNFKKFNDSYGHACGDYVLSQISDLMNETLREQDVVARWGGEEFLIMLPDTDKKGGVQAIEKLRQVIAETHYHYMNDTFSVTMTFGVTTYTGHFDVDTCIKQADEVLYAGKRGGRNRVIVTSE